MAMFRHWQQEPPVDVIAAAWVGFKPPSKTPKGPLKFIADRPPMGMESLRASFPGGVVRTH
jgi:hypothetical protein